MTADETLALYINTKEKDYNRNSGHRTYKQKFKYVKSNDEFLFIIFLYR